MTLTSHRIIQYLVILLILTLGGGGYWYWKNAQAAVNQKAASKTGLVGYWSFDEGSGTSAGDASGSGNTGTLTNGPTWAAGKLGQGVTFDGTNDYVTMGNVLNLDNSDMTVCAWAKWSGSGSGIVVSKGGGNVANSNGWYFSVGGFLTKQASNPSNAYFRASSGTVSTTGWTHVCAAGKYSTSGTAGQSFHFYTNGILTDGTETNTAATGASIGLPLAIGSRSYNNGSLNFIDPFAGSIDEVRIYNRALGATEITSLYNLGAAKLNTSQNSQVTNGLVGEWSFNGPDVSGTTAYDRSGSGNNGTLTNGPTAAIGKVGQGMSFDGSNDYMETSSGIISDSSSATFSTWVRFNASGAASPLYRGQDGFGAGWSVQLGKTAANLPVFYIVTTSGGATQFTVTGTTTLSTGIWYQITGVWTAGSSIKIYVNGTLEGTTATTTTTLRSSTVGVRLARASNTYYNVTLDEARIYNRAITAAEIKDLYALGESDKLNSSISQPQGTGRPDASLAGYWKLDENTGASTADATYSANTGTLTNGPTWTTGQIGSALSFDGTNDYVTLGTTSSAFNFSGSLSGAAWIKTATDGKMIVSYQNNNPLVYMQVGATTAGGTANKFVVYLRTNSGNVAVFNGSKTITDNLWHHVAFTRDVQAQRVILYVDGLLDSSSAYTDVGAIDTSGSIHTISNSTSYSFNGLIDDVRIYHRPLSAEEVAKLASVTVSTGVDSSLVGYWSFNGQDMVVTTARDMSTARNHGILTNGPAAAIGKLGQGMSFDGTNDWMNIGDVASLKPSTITLSAWIKTTVNSASAKMIFARQKSAWVSYALYVASGKAASAMGYTDSSPYSVSVTSSASVNDGSWHHVAVTYDLTSIKIYVDGALSGTTAHTQPILYTASGTDYTTRMGQHNNEAASYFPGTIDEARIYNRALSADEILALYNLAR